MTERLAFHETVETPEQVRLHLELAGLGTRSIAFILDTLIRYGLLTSLVVAVIIAFTALSMDFFSFVTRFGERVLVIGIIVAFFFMEWGYFALFEWLWNGQTPGKRAVHIRVLKDGGGPISFLDSAVRNLLRPIDSLGPMSAVGMLFIFFNRKHKRPGDLVAGTIVVRERPKTLQEVLAPPVTAGSAAEASPFAELIQRVALSADEHEMIARFFQRRAQLDWATRARLCSQVARVVLDKARAQPGNASFAFPTEREYEKFLEDLMTFHQNNAAR